MKVRKRIAAIVLISISVLFSKANEYTVAPNKDSAMVFLEKFPWEQLATPISKILITAPVGAILCYFTLKEIYPTKEERIKLTVIFTSTAIGMHLTTVFLKILNKDQFEFLIFISAFPMMAIAESFYSSIILFIDSFSKNND